MLGPGGCLSCPPQATTAEGASTTIEDCLCDVGHTGLVTAPDSNCSRCEADGYKDALGPAACTAS